MYGCQQNYKKVFTEGGKLYIAMDYCDGGCYYYGIPFKDEFTILSIASRWSLQEDQWSEGQTFYRRPSESAVYIARKSACTWFVALLLVDTGLVCSDMSCHQTCSW